MIPPVPALEQELITQLLAQDPVVRRYRSFFRLV
jgi:hypothetical protein